MATKKGSNKNDSLKGTNGDDVLYGLGGNDTLNGGNGRDELLGGDGNDLLLPGKGGNNAMDGGKGIDTLSYANFAATGVSIYNSITGPGYGGNGDAKGDTFRSIENLIGSNGIDLIYFGTASGKVPGFLYGGDGDDWLSGWWKVMRGDAGLDRLMCDSGHNSKETVWLQLNKGADTIVSFESEEDTLRISRKDFDVGALLGKDEFVYKSNSTDAVGDKAQFIYRGDTNALYFDEDGTGSNQAVLIATFQSSDIPDWLDFEIV